MKITSIILVLIVLVVLSSTIFSQVRNLKSMEGTWVGQWVNLYYSSTGNINIVITVNEAGNTAHGECNIGGNILGIPRDPFSVDITLIPSGFNASFTSPIWGDITGTGLYSGNFSGAAANCPNPNAQSMVAAGTFTNTHINGTFNFTWYAQPITGTITITKQDSILVPTGISAVENPRGTVRVKWTDNATNETGYRIDRRNSVSGTWSERGTAGANDTVYVDSTVQKETQYTYRVAAYNSSTESEYSDTVRITTVTSVAAITTIPTEFLLLQNYPNPFNPNTVISYILPRDSKVNISVYSISGKHIATLVDNIQTIGRYEVSFNSGDNASGIYFVKMLAQSLKSGKKYVDYKKMVFLK